MHIIPHTVSSLDINLCSLVQTISNHFIHIVLSTKEKRDELTKSTHWVKNVYMSHQIECSSPVITVIDDANENSQKCPDAADS